jgi:mannose-6-phosphate isomerase-like protein (cupin superfamily)
MKELEPHINPSLYQDRVVNPEEIVYELSTHQNGLPFGIAIADIRQSEPHCHKVTMETYTVVQGDLEVIMNTESHILPPGDVIKISPGTIHSAKSLSETPSRITVTTIPAFSKDDYFLVH